MAAAPPQIPGVTWDPAPAAAPQQQPPQIPGVTWDPQPSQAAPPSTPEQPLGDKILSAIGSGLYGASGAGIAHDVADIFNNYRGGTLADRAIASPEAQFAQHLLLNPAIGTGQIMQSPVGHLVAPWFDPMGTASDVAGALYPGSKNTVAFQKFAQPQSGSFNDIAGAVNKRVAAARQAVGDTGPNVAATLGDIGAFFLPLGGGKVHAVEEAAAAVPELSAEAKAAIKVLEDSHAASGARVAQAQRDLVTAQTNATAVAAKHLPTDNVYGANAAYHANKAAQAQVDDAQAALDAANASHAQSAEALQAGRNPPPVQPQQAASSDATQSGIDPVAAAQKLTHAAKAAGYGALGLKGYWPAFGHALWHGSQAMPSWRTLPGAIGPYMPTIARQSMWPAAGLYSQTTPPQQPNQ